MTVRDAPRATPLHLLPETGQMVAAMHAEGRTYSEIGEALGISRWKVWQLVQHIEATAR
jgi:DNA-binding CsgD family transcriptional regulator